MGVITGNLGLLKQLGLGTFIDQIFGFYCLLFGGVFFLLQSLRFDFNFF